MATMENIKELQQWLVIYYQAKKENPKNKTIKAAYQHVLDRLDEEGQKLPFPF